MPLNRKNYPADWEDISLRVREAAGWRCQWCGAGNLTVIKRLGRYAYTQGQYRIDWAQYISVANPTDGSVEVTAGMPWSRMKYHGLTKVILTVAHLDRNTDNNEPENLIALCQRCHLNHDRAAQHVPKRKFGSDYDGKQQLKLFKPTTTCQP